MRIRDVFCHDFRSFRGEVAPPMPKALPAKSAAPRGANKSRPKPADLQMDFGLDAED